MGTYSRYLAARFKTVQTGPLPQFEGALDSPWCLAGAQACPPDDVGGVPGYAEFLEAVANATHPEHDQMVQWYGGAFDPDAFDLDEVNQRLMEIRF